MRARLYSILGHFLNDIKYIIIQLHYVSTWLLPTYLQLVIINTTSEIVTAI